MDEIQFEALFAVVAFATTRYMLPKTILKSKIMIKEMIVLSLCYGLCAYIRKKAREERLAGKSGGKSKAELEKAATKLLSKKKKTVDPKKNEVVTKTTTKKISTKPKGRTKWVGANTTWVDRHGNVIAPKAKENKKYKYGRTGSHLTPLEQEQAN